MNCFNDGGPKNTQSFSDASVGYAFGCQPANNGPSSQVVTFHYEVFTFHRRKCSWPQGVSAMIGAMRS